MATNPYTQDANDEFISISPWLALEMSDLSLNAWKLFSLLIKKIKRKTGRREPTDDSNRFKLSYQDFIEFKIPRTSYNQGIAELIEKGFIRVVGSHNKKLCSLLKW